MPLTLEDITPKNFKVKVKGLELESKPPRLSHALILSKIGKIFQNADKHNFKEIKQAEDELDAVIGELIPQLQNVQLDTALLTELIEQLIENIEPADNQALKEKGVELSTDPKAEK